MNNSLRTKACNQRNVCLSGLCRNETCSNKSCMECEKNGQACVPIGKCPKFEK